MFGYIRPLTAELKVREFEQFKDCYCGLCRTLKNEYGASGRFLLTYDFTFLAMLLWDGRNDPETVSERCLASPVVKKCACSETPALQLCAGYSVILSWWKLKDAVLDEGFWVSLKDRLALLAYKGRYRKAARRYPGFEAAVRTNLEGLRLEEQKNAPSLDACADKFALITKHLATDASPDKKRPLEQLLYHTGRFIYLLDAYDDLPGDVSAGRFNPLAARFGLEGNRLGAADAEALKSTLLHSCRMISAAYELLPTNSWTDITRNIIYLGMPDAMNRVFEGTWHEGKNHSTKKGLDIIHE